MPGAVSTEINGVNIWGDLVGSYRDTAGKNHGFLDQHGHISTFDAPGATQTFAYGINDFATVVGGYIDSSNVERGFTATSGHMLA